MSGCIDQPPPDGAITLWRSGIWRPWHWRYLQIEDGKPGSTWEGRAWTRKRAFDHARIVRVLRRHGATWRTP